MPKKVMRGRLDAGVAVGDIDPVDQHEPNDLAERERDDGKIVALEAQHGEAEDDTPESGEQASDGQADPERPDAERRSVAGITLVAIERVGIGADRIEGDIAEIEQASEPDDDVQAPSRA